MKAFNYFFLISILLISCITNKLDKVSKISMKEANRIICETIDKAQVISGWSDTIYFADNGNTPDESDIIYDKKHTLHLGDFKYFKKNKNVKIISFSEARNNEKIRTYHSISFSKYKEKYCFVTVDNYFKGSSETISTEESTTAYFKYKIENGKCKLIRYRFN